MPLKKGCSTGASYTAARPDPDRSMSVNNTQPHEPDNSAGDSRRRLLQFDIHPPVFFTAGGLTLIFVIWAALMHEQAETVFDAIQGTITSGAGWFYIGAVNLLLLFVLFLIFSPYAKLRLGGLGAKPEFTVWGWFSMLFSAGMGIGLLFYSVAEPMLHLNTPPMDEVEPGSLEAARLAMDVTFFHWGLHAWAIYAVVGLALAFFTFNRGLPLTIRSVFYPLLGNRIHGPIGDAIDSFAVLATVFGVATSLGLGVQQIYTGIEFLSGTGVPVDENGEENGVQNRFGLIMLIALVTGIAVVSVVLGLDKGIRRLSEFNVYLALGLMTFVLIFGPTIFILNALIQNTGSYLQSLVFLSTWTEAYRGAADAGTAKWQEAWTIFYWAWWIAWSPFVGMFIARISKGRTIREFLLGVLLVPVFVTFTWLTVFGNSAIFEQLFGAGGITEAVDRDISIALFTLLDQFPLAVITCTVAVVLVVTFFVTSSDSGALVMDIICSGGNPSPPVLQRVFWAVLTGAVAAVLLLGGGLDALQTGAITTGLPFSIILLGMCYCLWKALHQEHYALRRHGISGSPYSREDGG